MYLIVTYATENLSFWRRDFPDCLLLFVSSLFTVCSALLTPHAILVSITRRLPKQQVAALRPRCTGRDFDAIFRAAWPILPWTSQAACGSGQLLPSIFSTLFRLCLAMQMSLHVNLRYMPIWNWLCLRRTGVFRAKIGTTGGVYPFAGVALEHRLGNFQSDLDASR